MQTVAIFFVQGYYYITMNKVKCPNCGELVEISEAFAHQIREEVKKTEKIKYEEEFRKEKLKLREDLKEESRKNLEKINEENKLLQEKLEKEQNDREISEKKIKEAAIRKAEEDVELKLKQKDIQLEQARKANQELNRKLEQGSQQLQGEALELNLEEKLRKTFPSDEFLPVPKGIEGADIWQKVKYKGEIIGSILWETKRTKAWSNTWLAKLKDDSAKVNASESIIVSQVLPEGIESFDRKEAIWITTYVHAISICRYVRFLITSIASVKSNTSQTDEEWSKIRDYMLSDAFNHRMKAHFEGVKTLRETLQSEKRSTTLRWKKQESQIDKLDTNTLNFYGELKNIAPDLPEIEGIDPYLLEEGTNESEQEELL